ncbi:MAG: glycoside hydrolase family 2 protein [Actinopolymorphaceae bacterium]
MRPIRRRSMLQAAALTPIAGSMVAGVPPALAAPAAGAALAAASGDQPPPHGDREPAGTELRTIDGTGVVFQYAAVVPAFDGWRTHEPTRSYRDLDRTWRFRFDPDAVGESEGWQGADYDDAGWDSIAVPSAWDLKDTPGYGGYDGSRFGEGTAFTDGYAWYRTSISAPADWAARHVRLAFLAVNYRADVWVNGQHVGAHEGGYAPFAVPTGDALRPGRVNVIAVRVHRLASYEDYTVPGSPAVSDPYAIPWKPVDYWPYAGITRSAWLEAVPTVTVAKLLLAAGDGRLEARAVVENRRDEPFTGRVVLDAGKGTGAKAVSVAVSVPAGGVAVAKIQTTIPDAPAWSPERPTVLTATAKLLAGSGKTVVDQVSDGYGMRTVEIADAKLLVDGEQVFLKALNWHEETAAHGRAMTRSDYDRELGHVRATNSNAVRNTVYTRHPYAYDWTDRHGVYVMDDIDNMWVNAAQEKLQTEQYGLCRALALTMAWNNHNHPSVVVWCLQNESEIDGNGAPIYRAWLADMKAAIKAVDLTGRPVTWASHTTNDPAFDLADIVGFNEYFGYFYGKNEDLGPAIDAVHGKYPDKPIMITENGSWSFFGHHGPETEVGTEEWQAMNFRSHWAQVLERRDYVAGYFFWVLKDYKTRAGYNQEYNGISEMGALAFDGTTKRLVYNNIKDAEL